MVALTAFQALQSSVDYFLLVWVAFAGDVGCLVTLKGMQQPQ